MCVCLCVRANHTQWPIPVSGKGERTHGTAVSRLVLFELLVFREWGGGWMDECQPG